MQVVVIPAYNEGQKIGRVIRGLFEHGFTHVVVVDDGSTDDTAGEARSSGATVLRHVVNRGQGAALQTGDEYALSQGATLVVHFDADLQFNPADIAPAIEALTKAQAEVLFGSRFLDARSKLPWFKRVVILPVARVLNFFFTGLYLSDAHNGFRILTRSAVKKIVIRYDGMAHNTDIVRQVHANALPFIEFPVEVTYHEYGQGVLGGLRIVADLIFGSFIK
jgi:glycosyltransferase involved in cell wall biosynthesis